MPLPASYTEAALAAFMEDELASVGADLAIGDTNLLPEAVNEIAGLLGHAVASETDVMKLRTLARWQAWLAARKAAARQFDTSLSGGKNFKLSQVWQQINVELAMASAAAARYPEGRTAISGGIAVLTSIDDAGPYGAASVSEFG
jgi:hypothetical protein